VAASPFGTERPCQMNHSRRIAKGRHQVIVTRDSSYVRDGGESTTERTTDLAAGSRDCDGAE